MLQKTTKEQEQQIIELCEQVAYDRKGENILLLDMNDADGAIANYYMICTGLSDPHIGAIAEHIQREVRNKYDVRPITVDGAPQSQWVIVDYGFLLIHVMTGEARERYQLESLWGDVPAVDVVALLDEAHRLRMEELAGKQQEQ